MSDRSICISLTRARRPCRAFTVAGGDYCLHHSPAHAELRELRNRRGGQGNEQGPLSYADEPTCLTSVGAAVTELERLHDALKRGEVQTNRARAMAYIIATAIGAHRDHTIEGRLAALEAAADATPPQLRRA